jgi:hypothetical protein
LFLEAMRIGDVVCIHPGDELAPRLARDPLGACRRARLRDAFDQPDPRVERCPPPERLCGAIRRAVIEDDELEIAEALLEDALDRRIEVRQSVVDRHDDTDRLGRHFLAEAAPPRWLLPARRGRRQDEPAPKICSTVPTSARRPPSSRTTRSARATVERL